VLLVGNAGVNVGLRSRVGVGLEAWTAVTLGVGYASVGVALLVGNAGVNVGLGNGFGVSVI
jgi:hypothetical protein